MRMLLLANDAVGYEIAEFMISDYAPDVAAIVTVDDNAISELARKHSIKTFVFDSARGLESALDVRPDLGVLAWWPKIIPAEAVALPVRGFINTHPSLLPHNRGKHYSFWAIVERAPFGVTIHEVDAGIDTGAIIAQREIPYDWCDTGETLHRRAKEGMVSLFREIYPDLRAGDMTAQHQEAGFGSYHHSSEIDAASRIDLDRRYKARELLDLMRARTFAGHPGCRFQDDGETYEVSVSIRKVKDRE